MREELRAACRADVDALHRGDARSAEDPLGDCPEIEVAPAQGGRAEARAVGVSDLVAHLVATRADAGPDDGSEAPVGKCRDARFENPLEQAEAARVQKGERRLTAAAHQ